MKIEQYVTSLRKRMSAVAEPRGKLKLAKAAGVGDWTIRNLLEGGNCEWKTMAKIEAALDRLEA